MLHADIRGSHAAATRIRVLVIDRDEAFRSFMARVLRDAGFETIVAQDGFAGCELVLESGPPDIVVIDESMPGMTGHDFSRWLRQRHARVKVLYLAGYADPMYCDRCRLWEDEGYLDKPCTARGLLQGVSLLLFRRLDADLIADAGPSRVRLKADITHM
jgi:DNA-binding response OmpR family regulator